MKFKINKTYNHFWLLVFIMSVLSQQSFSQLFYSGNIDENRYYLSLNSELGFNSNKLNNKFAGSFYKGEFLDHSMKTDALNGLNTTYNVLGFLFNTDLYVNIPGKKNNPPRRINYYAGLENHNMMELRFNRNFFQLFFFGNKDFTNQFLILKNLSLNYLNFQQIKVGINKAWQKNNSRHVLTAGIGFNNGQSLQQYELPYGTIYTQKDAEFINLQMELGMKRSDTLNSKFGAENGWGFSADLGYTYQDESNLFQCQLEDIGFIRWKKNSQHYDKDTIVYFDGIEINNLIDISGETISGSSADTILNAFAYAKKNAAFTETIPMKFYLSYKRYFFKRWLSLSVSFNHYFFSLYRPQIRFVPAVNIPVKNSVISISPSIEAGGYGRYNYGLGLSAAINKKFYVEIQTAYLNSYIFPKKSAGLGGFISIIKTL
ncbi:MAG TPA: DUF5723 family protein [Bacteroidales bacterium]|nr:DUF5723 family protein [Bacteroidales bacterium]